MYNRLYLGGVFMGLGIAIPLKSLRKSSGLTQKELAEKTGLSLSSIVSYENGLREPNAKSLEALVKYFDISHYFFLGEFDKLLDETRDKSKKMGEIEELAEKMKSIFKCLTDEKHDILIELVYNILEYLSCSFLIEGKLSINLPSQINDVFKIVSNLNNDGRNVFIERGKELTEINKFVDKKFP
jgi:transcriptional regulator with XRE-family HTH domain